MKSKKTLSLFIGNLDSPAEFEKYMETSYSKNEGNIKSNFMADFDLEVIDQDLVEANMRHKRTIDVETLVQDFSYYPSFRKEVIKRVTLPSKANVVIILFDYFADELGREPVLINEGYMKFCGTYEYTD